MEKDELSNMEYKNKKQIRTLMNERSKLSRREAEVLNQIKKLEQEISTSLSASMEKQRVNGHAFLALK